MQRSQWSILAGAVLALAGGLTQAQIPTTAERMQDSSFNPEYRDISRAAFIRLAKPDRTNNLAACFRKDFTLAAKPRQAAVTIWLQGPTRYWFAVNGQALVEPNPDQLQVWRRNFDITRYLRPGRNVLTLKEEVREWTGDWTAVEGIVFGEDGSTVRIVTADYPESGWRGGWNMADGWDNPERESTDMQAVPGVKIEGNHLTGGPDTPPFPYYGPIQLTPLGPAGAKMDHPIFDVENSVELAVTLMNMQSSVSEPGISLNYEIMDEQSRKSVGRGTVALKPEGKLDLHGNLKVGSMPLGTYRFRFDLMAGTNRLDRRDYEVACVGEIKQRTVPGASYEDGMDLKEVWRVDCTAEPKPGAFIASIANQRKWETVETRVAEGPAGRYRTFVENRNFYQFGYRFKVKRLFVPHLVVIEWPDDAARSFIAHVVEGSTMFPAGNSYDKFRKAGFQRAESSVVTKDDLQPRRSNRMQKLHLLYWPNEEEAGIHITNVGGAEAPAAAARITVYEIANDLPALQVADAGDRMIGPHTERGCNTMSSIYYAGPLGAFFRARLTGKLHPEYYRNWYTTTENWIKRMRFSGQNLYLMGHFAYEGTLYPTRYYHYTQDDMTGGDVIGDYTDLMLRMFERNGMFMVSAVEHFESPLFIKDQPTIEQVRAGAATHLMVGRNGEFLNLHNIPGAYAPNYFHPKVQEYVLSIVEELAELYGSYPAWKGVAFVLSRVWGPLAPTQYWDIKADPLDWGYEDWTIDAFQRETATTIPVDAKDPERFAKRYQWLMANAKQKWIDWRADQYTRIYRKMRDQLTAKARPGVNLYLCSGEPYMNQASKSPRDLDGHYDDQAYMKQLLKTFGFDVDALKQEPGLVINYLYDLWGSAASPGPQLGGWRELEQNQMWQDLFANDNKGGAWLTGSMAHYGLLFPEGKWLFLNNYTRQGYFYSTYAVEASVNVMARSNPTWMPHDWADVTDSIGRLHERRLFARAYRSLPNGKYERLAGNGLDRNIWISHTVAKDAEYAYAANLYWWETRVTLSFAPGVQVHDLIKDQPVVLKDNAWSFNLAPYSVQTFRITGGPGQSANGVRAAQAEIPEPSRKEAEAVIDQALDQTQKLVAGARSREAELRDLPGWRTLPYLATAIREMQALQATGNIAAAYAIASGGGLQQTRAALLIEGLQAIPFLIAGPFGKPEDTNIAKFGFSNPETVPDWRGMETPFIGESDRPDCSELKSGFSPDPAATYPAYGNRTIAWQKALKTYELEFPPLTKADPLFQILTQWCRTNMTPSDQGVIASWGLIPSMFWMVGYAYTEVYSPEPREIQIAVGSSQAIWVWVNDRQVIKHGGGGTHRGGQRPGAPGQNTGTALLQQGWNRVLVKAGIRRSAGIFLSLADAHGSPLTDLRFRVSEKT